MLLRSAVIGWDSIAMIAASSASGCLCGPLLHGSFDLGISVPLSMSTLPAFTSIIVVAADTPNCSRLWIQSFHILQQLVPEIYTLYFGDSLTERINPSYTESLL